MVGKNKTVLRFIAIGPNELTLSQKPMVLRNFNDVVNCYDSVDGQ
jgi:hypothetical protein